MRRLTLAALGVLGAIALGAQTPASDIGTVSWRVVPETVTVGQPFQLIVRAMPAGGRQAIAPAVPDTGGIVEPLDPAAVSVRGDTLTVRYRLLAWMPGVLTIPVGPVVMRRDSSDLPVPVDARIVVASVLPADSTARVPKDARELFPLELRWWERWWRWIAALVVLVGMVWAGLWWWHRRAERQKQPAPTSPAGVASDAFLRLDARGLIGAGEGGRHVALCAEIVRRYLSDVVGDASMALTNLELRRSVVRRIPVPETQIIDFFTLVDAFRFSGAPIDAGSARHVSALARELVRDVERLRATEAAADASRAA